MSSSPSPSHLLNLKLFSGHLCLLFLLLWDYFGTFGFGASTPADEVAALKEIADVLGKRDWNFREDPCTSDDLSWRPHITNKDYNRTVLCNCSYQSYTVCHVTNIVLKRQNLGGMLPPQLSRLPYLQEIDLTRNFLNGTIPLEWAQLPLVYLEIGVNRFFGQIPKELGNISTLKQLGLGGNRFSGVLPQELGNLTNLEALRISSNDFTGELPGTLAKLTNLKYIRIDDIPFTGKIPEFIQNWKLLEQLLMQGTSMEGPIPSGISLLKNMTDLRISDIKGTGSVFPQLKDTKNIKYLTLRNCNISGDIPKFIWEMPGLKYLDLSFNKLTGELPSSSLSVFLFVFLTGNLLSGQVSSSFLDSKPHIDLSYNNFTWESLESSECQKRSINLFESSSTGNNINGVFRCSKKTYPCQNYSYYLHINCGGDRVVYGSTTYEKDLDSSRGASFFVPSDNWAYSSTGLFMDDSNDDDSYTLTNSTLLIPNSTLYTSARLSPLSLSYYGFCIGNGSYTVKLHFAEIKFTNDDTYSSLGKRIFDVYIQGSLVLKDFNIEQEAKGVHKAVIKTFTANVTDNTLEIRFFWAGRGTQMIPDRGNYGPLISAISVDPDFIPPVAIISDRKKIPTAGVVGIVVSALSFVILVFGILWRKGCLGGKTSMDPGEKSQLLYILYVNKKL